MSRFIPTPPGARTLTVLSLVGACATAALACDSCGCHVPPELSDLHTGWTFGLYEQVTWFDTAKDEGRRIDNADGQWEHSSTTQAIIDYRFSDAFSLTAFVPYISRSYRRVDNGATDAGTVAGVGDSSLLLSYRPYRHFDAESAAQASLQIGIKAPTGDPSQLKGEEPGSTAGDQDPDSLVGGHDVALGDGAWDVELGANAIARQGRWYASSQVFFIYHTEGAYFYRFANELSGGLSIGYFLVMELRNHLGLQLNLTGDTKGHDWVAGQETPDTANHNVFIGPELTMRWHSDLTAMIGFDLPLYEHNSDSQLVPTWKARASFGWRF
jgi:hypothetical protein